MASDPVLVALRAYRVMAYIVGVGLVVLVFVGVPLQVWGGTNSVAEVVGFLHGILYMVYLVSVLNVVWRARLHLWTLVGMVVAGFLPFLAFIMERRITRRVEAHMAPD